MSSPTGIADAADAVYTPHTHPAHELTRHQRFVESLTAWFGRPATLYGVVAVACAWTGLNVLLPALGRWAPDPRPFPLLQGAITFAAFVFTTTVLITQNRQLKLSEKRSRLDLEINLTSERKIAKLIELLEELRRDMPNVRDRHDSEAHKMKERADPHAIADELDRRIEAEVGGAEPTEPLGERDAPGEEQR